MSGWGLLVGELGDGNQREQMEWNICSVLLQIYSEGKIIQVPSNNISFVRDRVCIMLSSGTGPGFALTVYL